MDKQELLQLIQSIKESTKAIMNNNETNSTVIDNEPKTSE